ncbi:UDP-glucosyltransferase 2-like [Cydia pomonella]|uniref:UDP-glucosyltransferase 2-like n=1 Tax=Cydia pomonella TaxID=82600 RepID=UPI002ADD505E|nr:UDP-glucosyltransferase 2-like [Cydia pomonella]
MLQRIIALAVLLLASSEALRILVVFPMASKSHSILGHGVVNHLLQAGHEVVHVTGFPRDKPELKLKEIIVPNIFMAIAKEDPAGFAAFNLQNIANSGNPGASSFFFNIVFNFHKLFFEEPNIVEFLSDPQEKFDAVIIEWFFSDVIAGIAPLFQCPLIWVGSTEAHWQVLKLVDGVTNPSYNADVFSANTPPLTFWQRVEELWTMVKRIFITSFIITPKEKTLYDSFYSKIAALRGVNMPSYDEAVYNGSFLLLNSHPSIGTPFNLPESAKYVGGYHIDSKVPPLPEDLQKLMDNVKHGVIYFSMGSNLKSVDMSTAMRESLLQMFAKLKQTVIWKFEGELDNVPSNIHLVKWAPQQSIFSHPNLKFFITHGGQLSTTEAIHYGVPVIGIPVLGDQYVNMEAVVRKGFGIKIRLAENMAEDIYVAIQEMLSNSSYKQKAKEISQIYHDRLVPPGAELVHWVEHVVRTCGAPHLRSPALLLPWYQKMYLDLGVLILFAVLILISCIPKKTKQTTLKMKEKKK